VLTDIVNRALAFYDAFTREYDDQRGGYRSNAVVGGRVSSGADREPVEVLAVHPGPLEAGWCRSHQSQRGHRMKLHGNATDDSSSLSSSAGTSADEV